ncbi:MAG: hypothetical protein U1E53_29345 [Dongiaceae bacterium]
MVAIDALLPEAERLQLARIAPALLVITTAAADGSGQPPPERGSAPDGP